MKLKIINEIGERCPNKKILERWLMKIVKGAELDKSDESSLGQGCNDELKIWCRDGYIELCYVTDAEITNWNEQYRGKRESTDVLSFSFLGHLIFPMDNLVGQVFISPKIAAKQADQNHWNLSQEIEFLFIHSILHIIGYNHKTHKEFEKMFGLHLKIMKNTSDVKDVIEKYRQESF